MKESEFDFDYLVEWFFSCYEDYAIECMPNRVGKIPDGADEKTLKLLDTIMKGVTTDV